FGLPATTLAVPVGFWLFWPRTAITVENGARIQKGMTRTEVEAILGGPARWEASSQTVLTKTTAHGRPREPRDYLWASDCALVFAVFDDDGLVGWTWTRSARPAEESLHEKLRRWLRL